MYEPAMGAHPDTIMNQQDTSSARQTVQDAPAWSGASASLNHFDFASAPSSVSMPSFDPAINALADLSFTQPPATSMPEEQPGVFQPRDLHDKKRIKVEPDIPALDSIDYWLSFDDDLDNMGSFEIDYSKRLESLPQNRSGLMTEIMPGLGTGLYTTAPAPFREEDFFDDSAFEQALSEDEEMFETTDEVDDGSTQPGETLASRQYIENDPAGFKTPPTLNKSQPGLLPTSSTATDDPRHVGKNACAQSSDAHEQRRMLEEALNSGRIPGALLPPNGFGIGFGAGMGCRPSQERGKRPASQHVQPAKSQPRPIRAKDGNESDEADSKKQTRPAATARASSSKRAGPSGQPKPRPADRIAHNDVERKYRTNLKDKISELRAAVPALQASSRDGEPEGGSAGGQRSGVKISKGTVLTTATEYIHHLEARNRAIAQEHQQLARRLQALETLLKGVGRPGDKMMPNYSMTLFDPRGFC
ncbi:uncharacterized protein UV8b_06241 [Ustilaginoidea virens]|uniref:BHLH domain-containing protein n=2 Tax=Ustilaginoidea virens TaxID=1159556 RepID=A0A8E5HUQ8_USTVR|nr:uncharacterized protein UV8b_06241 [Ustilaginoidea virens]QUC22000.1 hypothetical protein UV8b_06241 [Ustilaginoidea virens]